MKKIYFLLFTFLTTITYSQELFVNGNLDSWDDVNTPTAFTKIENTEQESTEFNSAPYSAKHTGGTSDLAQTITGIVPGTSYTIGLWYKVEAGTGDGDDARIWSYWKNGTTNLTDNADELRGGGPGNAYFDNNGNMWTEYTVTLTAPATADNFYFEVRTYSGAIVYWDDFSFVQNGAPQPTLTVVDGPASGSTVDLGPEELTGELEFATINFNVGEPGTGTQGEGYIVWNMDIQGGANHDSGVVYDTGLTYPVNDLAENTTYTFESELVDNSGNSLGTPVTYNLTITTSGYTVVTDITELRADFITNGDGQYYEITGNSLVSQTDPFRNRHWIQDNTISGLLIYDDENFMSTYNIGDNVAGLKGQTELVNNVLRFIPTTDSGVVINSGNMVTPQTVTISAINAAPDDYESELIELENVTFVDGDGMETFGTGQNYDVTNGANTIVKRTEFFTADYIGELIPDTEISSLIGVAGQFNGTAQIYVRSLSDFSLSVDSFTTIDFALYPNPVTSGVVNISSASNDVIDVMVYDILGKRVLNSTVENNTLNVSSLKAGIYILNINQNGNTSTKKLIIK